MMSIQKQHKTWRVLITKPKFEKKVAAQLNQLGIESYCPIRTEIRQWSDRKKKIEVPLLPSMILVNVDEIERTMVFDVLGVRRFLFWLGKLAKVSPEEVEALKMIEEQKYQSLSVEPMQVGNTIDLKDFGMQFGKGIIKKVSKQQCWVVLHSLGYVIKLKLEKPKPVKEYT